MASHLSFTGHSLLLSLGALFGFILLTIGLFRLYFQYAAHKSLKGRAAARKNKYDIVDVHQFRSSFIGLSLALTLGLTVLAFNWTSFDEKIDVSEYSLSLIHI